MLTDKQRVFGYAARAALKDFYADPENERGFQEWMKRRSEQTDGADESRRKSSRAIA